MIYRKMFSLLNLCRWFLEVLHLVAINLLRSYRFPTTLRFLVFFSLSFFAFCHFLCGCHQSHQSHEFLATLQLFTALEFVARSSWATIWHLDVCIVFFPPVFEHGFNWHFIVLYFCINLMNSLQMTIWRLVEYIVARENVSKSWNKNSHSCRALWITSTPTVHFQLPNTVLRMTLSFAEIKGHCHTKLSSDSAWTAKNNCVYGLFFFCQP